MSDFLRAALEIFVIFLVIYGIFRFLQGTRAEGIIRGYVVLFVLIFLGVFFVTRELELHRLGYLLTHFFTASFFALIIIFQPELRNGLIRLGQNPFVGRFIRSRGFGSQEIVDAMEYLAERQIGALIAIEREVGLGNYIEGGVAIDSQIGKGLIVSIFHVTSPLHDGAVAICKGRIAAAGCLLPLTDNPNIDKSFGTRHRAAIGLTEETDALVIVVSEENGTISICERSSIQRDVTIEQLSLRLTELETESEQRVNVG